MDRVVYRCSQCRELVPSDQDCARCGRQSAGIVQRTATSDKLAAAYHLAKGSFQSAKDHAVILDGYHPVASDELKHLAANFLRISELLVEAGFRP